MLCYGVECHLLLCYIMLLCCVKICYVMLGYVVLCCVVLFCFVIPIIRTNISGEAPESRNLALEAPRPGDGISILST